ncbi:SH3 domain-containing protein [Rhodoferax koreense]|uniref:SH3 domain-containing protein n=1 Tax=Rhodoferax koreensis TaxID=1842727 RepID=A0A1P8K1G2_9BURK|nr:SH3 domain-containing protein [Rhodoferax koreense]APW39781.1 SH3 domain-containing protein [Rhodoferax koreense]
MLIPWIHFLKGLIAAGLIGFGLAAAAQSIEVTTATELRAAPALDAKVLARVGLGARGERTGSQGGWVKVRIVEREGWLRLTHTKSLEAAPAVAAQPAVANPITGLAGMFAATSNKPTATTGTRGLTQEQLANAQPAPAEVQQLERYAVTGDQAAQFARTGKVVGQSFEQYTGADK